MLHVIGSTGYVGKRLVEKYQSEINIINLRLNEVPLNYDFDILKKDDVVAFCAYISEPSVCSSQYELAKTVNVDSTITFIERAIARECRVIFLSSDSVYGHCDVDFDEFATTNPVSVYGEMKAEVDNKFVRNDFFKSLRLSFVTSREDRFTKYLLNCADKNEVADIFDPFSRSVVHREDVVDAIISLSKNWNLCKSSIINCGGPQTVSRTMFTEIFKNKVCPNLEYVVTKPNEDFYKDRPAVISMRSPNLESILGRKSKSLEESIQFEFA